jgi:hypothetical protein
LLDSPTPTKPAKSTQNRHFHRPAHPSIQILASITRSIANDMNKTFSLAAIALFFALTVFAGSAQAEPKQPATEQAVETKTEVAEAAIAQPEISSPVVTDTEEGKRYTWEFTLTGTMDQIEAGLTNSLTTIIEQIQVIKNK